MTFYEHAMVGIDGALALGLHRRWGWPIVALAACESVLPDWDGLTILFGIGCYADGHRVWSHNFLITGLLAAIAAVVLWRFEWITRVQRSLGRRWSMFAVNDEQSNVVKRSWSTCIAWIAVGVAAAWIHLLGDVLFSIGHGLSMWGVPLLWPFSNREFAQPMVHWGDAGPTVVLAAGMFAMVRWPRRIQIIAVVTLAALVTYICARGCFL